MIEALIAYITDKGFTVDVIPGGLMISKQRGEEKGIIGWIISPIVLSSTPWEELTHEADLYMATVDRMLPLIEETE